MADDNFIVFKGRMVGEHGIKWWVYIPPLIYDLIGQSKKFLLIFSKNYETMIDENGVLCLGLSLPQFNHLLDAVEDYDDGTIDIIILNQAALNVYQANKASRQATKNPRGG